ncbi:ABC transporter ATP-binding protein [Candidatus Gracilibacteria bacterium]|nr:ABC transporter ATP-binding protein [Candidatus Gracilibacteria bacterium]
MSKSAPILSISHLSKKIGKTQILTDISLTLEKGEVFGFLGPNGSGKTTTMKAILGIIKPTTGNIEIFDSTMDDIAVRKRIGFMPENTYLYKYLTGDEFLDFNGAFYGMKKSELEKRKNIVLEQVGLTHARGKKLNAYSKGMLQRIGLAQAILHDGELIFLDEPMSGLDPVGRRLIKDLMLGLKKEGKTIFFNTHILSDVEAICDSFGIIVGGSLVANMKVSHLDMPLEDYFMEKVKESGGGKVIE